MATTAKLIYIHDPMCSWCWGYAPTWLKLKQELAPLVEIQYRVGGLAADSDQPMPESMQAMLESTWQRISAKLGTQFNFEFWRKCQPRRSTYPACRIALLARKQDKEQQMIDAIQQAYYLNAKNPSDEPVLAQLAQNIGLGDANDILQQLHSTVLNVELINELNYCQSLPIQGFPSLVLLHNQQAIAIEINYSDFSQTKTQIMGLLNSGAFDH